MRRGRILTGAALLLSAFTLSAASGAYAATPQDICNDLKDGVVNGSYTSAEWTAFFSDPTIQGYGCGGSITPPPVTPPVTPPTVTPPTVTPPTVTPTPPVALTPQQVPVVVTQAQVKGTQYTSVPTPATKPTATVKGAQHTVKAPATARSVAPLATTKTRGTLPFTGAQLTLFLLVGLALVATGLVLRTTGRRRPQE